MRMLRAWLLRLSGLFNKQDSDRELADELESNVQLHVDENIRSGMSPKEARRDALIKLGGVEQVKESYREQRGLRWIETLVQDVRFGMRMLAKHRGFTTIAIASLALGIGANTAVFTLTRQVLLDRLAVKHPEDLRLFAWGIHKNGVPIRVWGNWNETTHTCTSFSYPVYRQLRLNNTVFEDVFAFKTIPQVAVSVDNQPEPVKAELVSGNYYSALGVNTILGRGIQTSDDGTPGSGAVAVISDAFWSRHFGRSPDVIGKTIRVNLTPATIIGVNPREFTGASSVQVSPDIFLPLSMEPIAAPNDAKSLLTDANEWWILVMGRLKSGVSDKSAGAAMDVVLNSAVRSTMTVEQGQSVPRMVIQDGSRGEDLYGQRFTEPIYVLIALAAVVLLLACANLGNLLLARASSRRRELSVRLAVGAKPGRLVRQMLTESLLLSGGGGLAGLLLGYCGRNAIPRLMSSPWGREIINVRFDWKIFGFTAVVSIFTGLLFGFIPAWQAMHTQVSGGLKENVHAGMPGGSNFSGRTLVSIQIALSMLLLVGAGLFIRTLTNLNKNRLGFRPDNLVLFEIQPPNTRYPAPKDKALFWQIEQRLASTPGINSVTLSKIPLVGGNVSNDDFVLDDLPPIPNAKAYVDDNVVGQDFFATMGIPILSGRGFDSGDSETSQPVAVINQQLAKDYFPDLNPIGRTFLSNKKHIEIIGVSADTRYSDLRNDPPATFYILYRQQSKAQASMTFEISSKVKASAIIPFLREAVGSVDRDLPLLNIRTQNEQISDRTKQERMFASLTSGFGLLALILACIGIYGVMAYTVSRRANEIAVRMALGAQRGRVLRMVLRDAWWLAFVGVIVGVGAALGMGRLIASMLYGLKPNDSFTLVTAALLLIFVALAASWVPAYRAASIDPMRALRNE
ncbi:MAG TPA: ABC transporter permease [Candidatus Acidoferrales bacterium]|nr:ABC transporter permease [Candidatus Acidoferrales bacterium]